MFSTRILCAAFLCGFPAGNAGAAEENRQETALKDGDKAEELVFPFLWGGRDFPERPESDAWPITIEEPPSPPIAPSFKDFHHALAYNFTRGLFSRENLLPMVVGSLGTLAVAPFDDDVKNALAGSFNELGETGHIAGGPVVINGTVGALLRITPFTDNDRFRAFTFTVTQALILDNALVFSLKAAARRERPNGANNHSFPSGHASNSIAFATVAGHYYGKKVGIPAFIGAILISASRLEKNKHYLSDIVFGATLGYISARTAMRGTERTATRRRTVSVLPSLGAHHTGVKVIITF